MKTLWTVVFRIFLGVLAVVLAINVAIQIFADSFLTTAEKLPKTTYWMVLWASVYRDGSLSDVLRDRVDTALEVYNKWGFERFFVSGDDSEWHGEIRAIVAYLKEHWITEWSITTDGAGYDTYDSMRRAKKIYNIDSMVIFTQAFHLSRSVYIANRIGISAYGIITDKHEYVREPWFIIRETWARIKAFLDVEVLKSLPREST